MKRTREWWARLTGHERSWLVLLEQANSRTAHGSAYYPDDAYACNACGNPGHGALCDGCGNDLDRLLAKAGSTTQGE